MRKRCEGKYPPVDAVIQRFVQVHQVGVGVGAIVHTLKGHTGGEGAAAQIREGRGPGTPTFGQDVVAVKVIMGS